MTEQELANLYVKADTSDKTVKDIEKEYKALGRFILAEVLLLWNSYPASTREFQLPFTIGNIDKAVDEAFESVLNTIFRKFSLMYTRVLKSTNSQTVDLPVTVMNDIIDKAWAKDGKTLTARITKAGTDVKLAIRYTLYEQIQNEDIKQVIKNVNAEYSNEFYKLDRITRTETNRLINEALKFSFESQKFDGYRYSAILDSRTSSICRSMDGKVFSFDEYQQGVTAPPLHPFVEVSSSL